jgi:hypothetical protein
MTKFISRTSKSSTDWKIQGRNVEGTLSINAREFDINDGQLVGSYNLHLILNSKVTKPVYFTFSVTLNDPTGVVDFDLDKEQIGILGGVLTSGPYTYDFNITLDHRLSPPKDFNINVIYNLYDVTIEDMIGINQFPVHFQ